MTSQQRREEYLAKAKEADEHAAKANGQFLRDAWVKITDGYRDLARLR